MGEYQRVNVVINGEERQVPAGLSVSGLLKHLDLNERLVVVELNREILRRPQYGETSVRPGDEIELVHFVGGG